MEVVASALVGIAAFGFVVGAWSLLRGGSSPLAAELLGVEERRALARREGALLRALLPPAPFFLLERTDLKALDAALAEVGRPYGLTAEEFVRFRLLTGVLSAAVVVLLFSESGPLVFALLAIAAAGGGYRLPDLWLASTAGRRLRELERALPNMVDALVLAMDAGMDLESALRRVVPKLRGPLRESFDDVLAELGAGFSLASALDRLQTRTRSSELGDLVSLIQQSRRLGVGLASGLRQRAQEMRVRRRQRAQEAAQRAPLKMTLPLVLFFLPALLIVFLAPALLSFLVGG